MRCINCGTDNPDGTKFCGNCGGMLESPVTAAPVNTNNQPVTAAKTSKNNKAQMDPGKKSIFDSMWVVGGILGLIAIFAPNGIFCTILAIISLLLLGFAGLGLKMTGHMFKAVFVWVVAGIIGLFFIVSLFTGKKTTTTETTAPLATETTVATTKETTAATTAETTEAESSETSEASEDTSETSSKPTGIRPEFKKSVDDYEKFVESYCKFLKKMSKSDNYLSMLTDYYDMLAKLTKYEEEFDDYDTSVLSDEELKYYNKSMDRIAKKLLEAEAYMIAGI